MRPYDVFYQIKAYHRAYGSVNSAKMKTMKHNISVMDGVMGVVVPGDQEQPWRLRSKVGQPLDMNKSLTLAPVEEKKKSQLSHSRM